MILKIFIFLLFTSCAKADFTCDQYEDCKNDANYRAVPDNEDCRKFYLCENKEPVEPSLDCKEGTHFYTGELMDNYCVIGDCDQARCFIESDCKSSCYEYTDAERNTEPYPQIVDPRNPSQLFVCYKDEVIPDTCGDDKYFDGITCNTNETYACDSICGLPICSADNVPSQNFPDRYDCKNYYVCLNGERFLQSCTEDLVFDIVTANCISNDMAICSPYCSDPSIPESTTTEDSSDITDESGCYDVDLYLCEEEGHFAYCPNICHRNYIECDENLSASEEECVFDYYFNADAVLCVPLEDCEGSNGNTDTSTSEIISPTTDQSGCVDIDNYSCDEEGYFAYCPNICHQQYVKCDENLDASVEKCLYGYYFNAEAILCLPLQECESSYGNNE